MARRGNAIHKRGPSWFLDCEINGTHYHRKLGKGITLTVAQELAQVERAAILKGEAGIGKKAKDLSFDGPETKFEAWAAADKKSGTTKTYRELPRLAESFSGMRLS